MSLGEILLLIVCIALWIHIWFSSVTEGAKVHLWEVRFRVEVASVIVGDEL